MSVAGQAKITGCDNLFTVSYIYTSFGNIWSVFLMLLYPSYIRKGKGKRQRFVLYSFTGASLKSIMHMITR